jgi:uncharacterized protein
MRVSCPTCGAATTWEENRHRPFCSERCRLIDLGRWATEAHRIPGEPVHEPQEHANEPAADEAPEGADDRTGA